MDGGDIFLFHQKRLGLEKILLCSSQPHMGWGQYFSGEIGTSPSHDRTDYFDLSGY